MSLNFYIIQLVYKITSTKKYQIVTFQYAIVLNLQTKFSKTHSPGKMIYSSQ